LPPKLEKGGKKERAPQADYLEKRSLTQNQLYGNYSTKPLFVWSDIEEMGDLERLWNVLEVLPDEALMRSLEEKRGRSGVDKYPVRAVWNSIIAMIVFGHRSVEELRRELKRNAQLRQICGFDITAGLAAVPNAGVYSRFFASLGEHSQQLQVIFASLVSSCYEEIDGFGRNLGIDGKALESHARRRGKREGDRRGEREATWGKHVVKSEDAFGNIKESVKKWFGFTLHLIADTEYELPVDFSVLPASENEMPVAHRLIDRMGEQFPERLRRCEYFSGDRGYDDGKLHRKLWDEYRVKPIIDIRNSWRDGEQTRALEKAPGVVYSNKGEVYCVSPYFAVQRGMAPRGFEKDRECLKYRCPAVHYGIECEGRRWCELPEQVRIPITEDRRIFSPVARDSYKWQDLYNRRSAVERVNSRIDRMFGFEEHTIRGLEKMRMRLTLAFIVMISHALGKVRENKEEEMRRFYLSA
jgi:hypothetical protein